MRNRFIGLVLFVLICSAPLPCSSAEDAGASDAEPIRIGHRTCLFLNERFISQMSGVKRTWHQGIPHTEPAITATEKWEKWPHLFGSVLYDLDLPTNGGRLEKSVNS
ncbi:MAG: hypothetical protein ACKVT0_19735, partial [Planctomycetaceae bacterium]